MVIEKENFEKVLMVSQRFEINVTKPQHLVRK